MNPPSGNLTGRRQQTGPPVTTVLYVGDDILAIRRMEATFDTDPGMNLIPAIDTRFAMQLARGSRPAVILIDRRDMSGVDLVWELKTDPLTVEIPVVVISTYENSRLSRAMLDAGAAVCLPQPVQIEPFLDVVRSFAEEWQGSRSARTDQGGTRGEAATGAPTTSVLA